MTIFSNIKKTALVTASVCVLAAPAFANEMINNQASGVVEGDIYAPPSAQSYNALTIYGQDGTAYGYLNLYSNDQSLPRANGQVFVPGPEGRKRYLYEQPRIYEEESKEGFAGVEYQ